MSGNIQELLAAAEAVDADPHPVEDGPAAAANVNNNAVVNAIDVNNLVPAAPHALEFLAQQPALNPDLMPGWYRSGQVLQSFFKEICKLVYRSGFQSVINNDAIRLFNEGVGLFQVLQESLPSSQRSREENEEQLELLEARCNGYKESVLVALTEYDIALNLEQTVDLSDEDEPAANHEDDDRWSYEPDWSVDTNTSSGGVDDLTDLEDEDEFPGDEQEEGEEGEEEEEEEGQASSVITIDSDSDVEVAVEEAHNMSVEIIN